MESVKKFEGCGIKLLHLVDLDGAKAQEPINLVILEKIATKTSLKVEFGGGIKSRDSGPKVRAAATSFSQGRY